MDNEGRYRISLHANSMETETVIQLIKLFYARFVIAKPDELNGNMFLGTAFGFHTLDQVLDESSNIGGLPLSVREDIEA